MGSALLGSVGPFDPPFSPAAGLTRAACIGTEAASALILHLTKTGTYSAAKMLTSQVLLYGIVLSPATLLSAWLGKQTVGRISDRIVVLLVETGSSPPVAFLIGL